MGEQLVPFSNPCVIMDFFLGTGILFLGINSTDVSKPKPSAFRSLFVTLKLRTETAKRGSMTPEFAS